MSPLEQANEEHTAALAAYQHELNEQAPTPVRQLAIAAVGRAIAELANVRAMLAAHSPTEPPPDDTDVVELRRQQRDAEARGDHLVATRLEQAIEARIHIEGPDYTVVRHG